MGGRDPTTREVRPLPRWLALGSSAVLHMLLFVALPLWSGGQRSGGERGALGAAGNAIEVTVARAHQPLASVPSPLPAEPSTGESRLAVEPEPHRSPRESERTTGSGRPHRSSVAALGRREVPPERSDRPASMARLPELEPPDADASESESRESERLETREPGPPDRTEPSPGTRSSETTAESASFAVRGDSDTTGSGRAPGEDVAAMILGSAGWLGSDSSARAFLERALECGDPIEGRWVAYRYSPEFRDWARFTLDIERVGDALRGTILSRTWSGGASDRRPPPCRPGQHDVTVRMNARGSFRAGRFWFGADSYEIVRVDCAPPFFAYNPDHFTGTVDPIRNEIDALNNDGGRDVNAPYRFRRVACLER